MLKCAQCVTRVSTKNYNYNAEKKERGSVYLCALPVRILSLRLSIRRWIEIILHYVTCVATTSRPELVFFWFKTSAGTSNAKGVM